MLRRSYDFGHHISDQVKSLISVILQFQPEKRPNIEDIYEHPWIREMSNHINTYLDIDNTILPKEVSAKFSFIPLPSLTNSKF